MKNLKRQKLIATVVGAVTISIVLGLYAGTGVSGILRSSTQQHASLALVGKSVRLAGSNGSGFGSWIQRDASGNVCLLYGRDDGSVRSGGCNPASSPLGGQQMLALYTFDGGPQLTDVTDARLTGLVTARVASVSITMSNGATHSVALVQTPTRGILGSNDRSFAYQFSDSDFAAGIGPAVVVAYGASGNVVGTDRLDNILP